LYDVASYNFKESELKYQKLGQIIASARISAGFSNQADLATAMSCTQQTISKWEAGTSRPRTNQIQKIAGLLNLKSTYLLQVAGYTSEIPAIVSFSQPFPIDKLEPETFERFITYLLEFKYGNEATVRKAGTSGHKQDGLDVTVEFEDKVYSFQCKRTQQFGPADVARAVAAHTAIADKKHLVLSRVASPQTTNAIKKYPDWELWDKEYISQIIRTQLSMDAQNRLVDMFFRGQRLSLLGRSEPGPWQTVEEFFSPLMIGAAYFTHKWPLKGRSIEISNLHQALQAVSRPLVLLTGAAGMGKSRVLMEALSSFQKLQQPTLIRLLSPTEEVTRQSLDDLGDGPKILVIDDAHDRDGLSTLLHYAAIPQNQTRLLFATRPYAKSRIANEAALVNIHDPLEIELGSLKLEDITALAREVLSEQGVDPSFAEDIVEVTRDNPLVTAIAARIMAKEKIPFELAKNQDAFRRIILGKFSKVIVGDLGSPSDAANIKSILDVLAAVQPFHIEDHALISLIQSIKGISPEESSRLLKLLLNGSVIYQRGHQFRLMPDLLGDYLIEESCIGKDNRLSSFATLIFEKLQAKLLEHFLVNLGRMDWRLTGGNPNTSNLLNTIWDGFKNITESYDPRLTAIQAVAMYQPRQSLEFVENRIRHGVRLPEFSKILRGISYHLSYLERVCEALWELGRNNSTPLNSYIEHPIRTMTDLCSFDEYKPLEFVKKIYEFGLVLASRADSWGCIYSPLDILAPILSVEGFNSRSKGKHVVLSPFYTNPQAVHNLRQGVIQKILELMQHQDIKIAQKATSFISQALRFPMGILESKVPQEFYRHYEKEFIQTLSLLKDLSDSGKLYPTVQIMLADEISWHTFHAQAPLQKAAKAVLATFPTSPEFRLMTMLAQGFQHDIESLSPLDKWGEKNDQRLLDLNNELKATYSTEELHDKIEKALMDLQEGSFQLNTAYMLINRLLKEDLALATSFLNTASFRPSSPIALFCSNALDEVLKLNPSEGRRIIGQYLLSADQNLARAASNVLGTVCRHLDEESILLVEEALTSPDMNVVNSAIYALRFIDTSNPRIIIELARKVHLHVNYKYAQELFVLFRKKQEGIFNALTKTDIMHFLNGLKNVPKLEGHWVEEFLSALSEQYPIELLDFIILRVEHAVEINDYSFRPINYGPFSYVPLQFYKSPQAQFANAKIWKWLLDNQSTPAPFHFHASNVVGTIFAGVNGNAALVAFLESKLDTATIIELEVIGTFLRKTEQNFIFTHTLFVVHLLERCLNLDLVIFKKVMRELYGSATSGSRSGLVGEPFPEDIQQRDQVKEILAQMSRLSPAYELYESVLKAAESAIERSLKEAEEFE
jgi:transcriptional regulator with XRE-family HTH domain